MSLRFAKGNRYICIPKSIVHLEEFPDLTGKQLVLLLWLVADADTHRNGRRHKNRDLARAIKVHENRVPPLRNKLVGLGLLEVKREADGHRYTLLNPETRQPVHVPAEVNGADEWGNPGALKSASSSSAPVLQWEEPEVEDTGWVPDDAEVQSPADVRPH
jgi:hypothetical protein